MKKIKKVGDYCENCEFKRLYPSGCIDGLIVLFLIIGAIVALFSVMEYSISVASSTISSGTFISTPILLISFFFFAVGIITGVVNVLNLRKSSLIGY